MTSKALRTARRIALALLGSALLLLGIAVAVVNLVLTNGRLMPIIKSYAHEYLDAEVSIGNAEGTIFASFPYIGVKLDSCVVVTNAFHRPAAALADSAAPIAANLRARRDTLAQIDRVVVGLNLVRYLLSDSDELRLGLIALERPRLRLETDSAGRAAWDILRPAPPSDTAASATRVSVRHIVVNNARIAYFNRPDQVGVFADSLRLRADGDIAMDNFDAELELDIRKVSMGHRSTRYLRRMPLGLSGNVAFNADSARYELGDVCMKVASADIDLDGWLRPDGPGAYVNIDYSLSSPSAAKLFDAIPKSLISSPVDIRDGAVDLRGYIRGMASATEMPVVCGKACLDHIKAQYEGRPEPIDDLTADFNMLIDKSIPDSSYISLDIFHFKGGKSEVSAVVRVSRLLAKALMDCKVKAHIDLENLQRVIPFDNTSMSGIVDADLSTRFAVEDIVRRNYGNAKLDGQVRVERMRIVNDSSGVDIDIDGDIRMKTDQTVEVSSTLDSLRVKAGAADLRVRGGKAKVRSVLCSDTTRVVPLTGQVEVSRVFFKGDSVVVFAKNIRTDDRIAPRADAPRLPEISHDVRIDTIFAGIVGNGAFVRDLHIAGGQKALADTIWHTTGLLEYGHVGAKTPHFRLPIQSRGLRMTIDGDTVRLDGCEVKTGRSDLRLSGHVRNAFSSIRRRKPLLFSLEVAADTIDCNELMAAVVTDSATIAQAREAELDTTAVAPPDTMRLFRPDIPPTMILVPRFVELDMRTRVKHLTWDQLELTDISGLVKTRDGAAHMTNLSFKIGDAQAVTTLAYKAWPHTRRARANLSTRWQQTDIATLAQATRLDSLLPILKPMRGKLDCYVAAELELDSLMDVVVGTARAAIHLDGQKLTLMDNDSFRKIGKKLMFKNKDRNVIDTLSLNVLLDSGRIQVLPFVVSIDRYRLAAGGTQDLEMNMRYHVSVLKSPLPFKAGVNIVGTPSDFDVDITTAKLKRQVTPQKLAHNDTISLMMRMAVLRNSYLLSGQPMPEYFKSMEGLDANTNFAVKIGEDEATEQERREADMARRAQMMAEAADTTSQAAPPDTTTTTTQQPTR